MKKSTAALAAAGVVAAAAAVWAGGVLASSIYAEKVLQEGCARVSGSLDAKTEGGIMPFSIKVSYKKSEGGFFSEKGVFAIESSDGKSIALDAATSHGFLSFNTKVDLLPVLNNLFVKSGVLVMAKSDAGGEIKARLLPPAGSFTTEMGGQYSRSYLRGARLQPMGQKLSIKTAATGLESDSPKLAGYAEGVIAPGFKAKKITATAFHSGKDDPGTVSVSVKGFDADDLGALSAVDEASAKFESVKSAKKSDFDLRGQVALKGPAGNASLAVVLGPFSREKALKSGAAVTDIVSEPAALGNYYSDQQGFARIEKLEASADTDLGFGRIAFNAKGSGSFAYKTSEGLEEALKSATGSADASVSGLSKVADQWLQLYGGSILERTQDGYKAHFEAKNNRIKINGKDF
jgi:hypothetical protein